MSHAALDVVDVGLTYPTRRGSTQALAHVNLRVEQGEFVALLGPSGCGKSTLLRLAAGLLTATEGQVQVAGRPIARPDRRTGVVFQKPNLLPWKTVRGNVLMPAQTLGLEPLGAARRADELLQLVGLSAFANGYPQEEALAKEMFQLAKSTNRILTDDELHSCAKRWQEAENSRQSAVGGGEEPERANVQQKVWGQRGSRGSACSPARRCPAATSRACRACRRRDWAPSSRGRLFRRGRSRGRTVPPGRPHNSRLASTSHPASRRRAGSPGLYSAGSARRAAAPRARLARSARA